LLVEPDRSVDEPLLGQFGYLTYISGWVFVVEQWLMAEEPKKDRNKLQKFFAKILEFIIYLFQDFYPLFGRKFP
jgi:hypothetical protein